MPRHDWRATARRLALDLAALDPVDLASRLTLLNLMVGPVGRWYIRPAVLLLCAAGLLLPNAARLPSLWLWLAWLTALRVLGSWPQVDNHAYLLSYWCLALAIVHALDDSRALRLNGRLLIALVFALATLQKAVLAPDYLDGRFFRFTFVTDPRFEAVTRLFGGMDAATLEENRQFLLSDRHGDRVDGRHFVEPPAFRAMVSVSTCGVLAIEALVAWAFLVSWPRALHRARDGLLIAFCATTYAVAPVPGFGWLLVVMGISQADERQPWIRPGYLAAWALILVYEYVPWASMLLDWLSPA